jgi:hypothetical protein
MHKKYSISDTDVKNILLKKLWYWKWIWNYQNINILCPDFK